MGIVHVIGAGLAGLSAAVNLAGGERRVVVHEAAPQAGGRCRSYHDGALDLTIDNGNHLLLSGNAAALEYLERTGAPADALEGPAQAEFPFADLATGERWTLRPNDGRVPWWVLDSSRRVPGTRARDYMAPLGILRAAAGLTIGESMTCEGPLWERLWHPVLLAALNTEPRDSDAGLGAQILRETLGAGGRACRPMVATGGLSAAFVDPALRFLAESGGTIEFGRRLRRISGETRAESLDFADGAVDLSQDDAVVLAVPAWVAPLILPSVSAPRSFRAIVNAHFAVLPPPGSPLLLGVVGGTTEWLFAYPDRLSVTISGADRLLETPREALAETIWAEVRQLTGLDSPLPRWQIVKERRATFAATPEEARRRPGAGTSLANVAVAGDWTATGLPATIEGAIRSGVAAARHVAGMPAAARLAA